MIVENCDHNIRSVEPLVQSSVDPQLPTANTLHTIQEEQTDIGGEEEEEGENSDANENTNFLLSNHPRVTDGFRRMSGYFNILDRVFHPKRLQNVTTVNGGVNNDASIAGSSSSDGNGQRIDTEARNETPANNIIAQRNTQNLEMQTLPRTGHQPPLVLGRGNDGVFSNLSAKPDVSNNDGGRIYDGEITSQDKPPTYEEAAADAVPPYWDLSPEGAMYYDEICVDGLPAGNLVNFIWNAIVSASFQFFGFLITYILHTSHAAKEGSRCGLGITFIGYGWTMLPNNVSGKVGKDHILNRLELNDPNEHNGDINLYSSDLVTEDSFHSGLNHGYEEDNSVNGNKKLTIISVLLFILGGIIIVKCIYGYFRIKRIEKSIIRQQEEHSNGD
ncbi:uncharacterized protein SCODWIG_03061 [Saccharomycodes ludwigii]|uniref:Metal homeostatis protein BSD2 n=1 Tax=Saccharomycodes ludwigii TaxID=36035 RepID=A0A376BAX2_9ASCO|nr:hypothetical protein SCDLUD_003122 [Saccharomycodes ludwigii]KAH3900152.1 hypothetical protein SCDLUD_003122 [Saccharomycodes ludwigii]SSD61300.1 uncharacterized protein SCODWIG_03061 [Saccharomycodes ludwigii]